MSQILHGTYLHKNFFVVILNFKYNWTSLVECLHKNYSFFPHVTCLYFYELESSEYLCDSVPDWKNGLVEKEEPLQPPAWYLTALSGKLGSPKPAVC